MSKKTFYQHFKFSMDSLGLPTPNSLFGTYTTAVATIGSIATAVKTYGTSVTVGELIGAGVLSEKLAVAATLGAAFYLGACVGALAYALGQWTADNLWASNASPGEIQSFARRNGIELSGSMVASLLSTPIRSVPGRAVAYA